jgi:hypothetical protein
LEDAMVKEQKRGNREAKKPKKEKAPAPAQAGMAKGISSSIGQSKKK